MLFPANAIAQDPFDSNHILAGSAAGGLFGTSDGGSNWSPLTDDFAWMAMGSITFHPSQEGVGSKFVVEPVSQTGSHQDFGAVNVGVPQNDPPKRGNMPVSGKRAGCPGHLGPH